MGITLITGCSSGFGLGTAVALARRGETVVATMRDLSRSQPLRAVTEGLPLEICQLDITDAESRVAAIEHVIRQHGRIDVLVNNAGVFSVGPMESLGESNLRTLFETNVFATFALTNLVLPAMRERRSGRIVNVTSAGAFQARQFMAGYTASKHAMDAISVGMDMELKAFDVRVTSVAAVSYGTAIADNTPRPSDDTPYGSEPVRHYDEWKTVMMGRPDLSPVVDAIVEAATVPNPRQRYLVAPERPPFAPIFDEKVLFDERRRELI